MLYSSENVAHIPDKNCEVVFAETPEMMHSVLLI